MTAGAEMMADATEPIEKTVGHLRAFLEGLPDDLPVYVPSVDEADESQPLTEMWRGSLTIYDSQDDDEDGTGRDVDAVVFNNY